MTETTTVHVHVLAVTPVTGKSRLLALASAEIAVAGVAFILHGILGDPDKRSGDGRGRAALPCTGRDLAAGNRIAARAAQAAGPRDLG